MTDLLKAAAQIFPNAPQLSLNTRNELNLAPLIGLNLTHADEPNLTFIRGWI